MKVRTVALLSKSKYRFLQMTILLGIVGIVGWLTACSGLDGGYTVTFESNGGSAVSSQQVEAGGKAQAPDDPAKENKYFAGWYSDSTFNNPYEFNKFTLIENITLYAKWDDLIDISSLYTITVAEKTATAGEASVLNLTVEKNYVSLSVEDYTLAITARPAGASINALTINVEGQIAVADTVASADAGDYTIEAKGKNAYTGTLLIPLPPLTPETTPLKRRGRMHTPELSEAPSP